MEPITVQEIIEATGGVQRGAMRDFPPVSAVSTDSRNIPSGCLFLPLTGERFDGHQFIPGALESGAAGCLCRELPEALREDKFYIQVPDTRLALGALASFCRGRVSLPVVQITGSVGKTTTKEMIASVLEQSLQVLKTPGNFNNDIGTPLTLLDLSPKHQAAVIETGMNHFGEIRYLGEMVRPSIAVISNIGDAHIEFLKSRQGILQAKCEIFDHLNSRGLAVLNGDDPLLNTIQPPFRTVRCGHAKSCQVRITGLADHGIEGIECTVTTERDVYRLSIPVPGEHMAYSASMAVAVGEELGLRHGDIVRGVAAYRAPDSRMRILRLPGKRVILDDCYNANPQSVTAALEILAKTECDRRVAVLGDMGELGTLTGEAHYNVGALAAMLGIDFIAAIGVKAVQIADGAAQSGGSVLHFSTKEESIAELEEQLSPGTTMLVKASHAMRFQELVEHLCKIYD